MPLTPHGDLPLEIDFAGISAQREIKEPSDVIHWLASDVAIVNRSDEHLHCRVRLVVLADSGRNHDLGQRELSREPNDLLALEPHGHDRISFEFLMDQAFFLPHTCLSLGHPDRLVFREVGTSRSFTVPFAKPAAAAFPRPEPPLPVMEGGKGAQGKDWKGGDGGAGFIPGGGGGVSDSGAGGGAGSGSIWADAEGRVLAYGVGGEGGEGPGGAEGGKPGHLVLPAEKPESDDDA